VKLRGHAVVDPPVIRIPSGQIVLGRMSTSFSYRLEPIPIKVTLPPYLWAAIQISH
jgi:hypothetical protein